MDASAVPAWLDDHDIRWVKTESVSLDGLVVGKHLGRTKFTKTLPLGNAITDLVLGYDMAGTPYLAWWDAWRADALGDIYQRPDLDTLVVAPDRARTANVLCDFVDAAGDAVPSCPRGVLRRVLAELGNRGSAARAAFEIEAMLFTDSLDGARRRHFGDLTPMATNVPIGYLHHNSRQQLAFVDETLARLEGLGIAVEGWHDEAAPGQFEVNLDPTDPLAACDAVIRAKQAMREVALEQGHVVTFMAKPSAEYGNGLHVHHSLVRDGEPVFYAPDGAMSPTMEHWIGGLMASSGALTSFVCPTINSYRRMVGFAAAPTVASWGEDNKSAAIRVLSIAPAAARIEYRVAGGDANPYLVLASVLAAGIAGIDRGTDLPPPISVSGWGLPPGRFPHLPTTITRAADTLEADHGLAAVLGSDFVAYWLNTRRWEWLMFNTSGGDPIATTVTPWELDRYFEPRERRAVSTRAGNVVGIVGHIDPVTGDEAVAMDHYMATVGYVKAVHRAGAIPVILPVVDPADVDGLLDAVDAVVITGGRDVDPAAYGEAADEHCGPIDPRRDASDLAVARAVVARDVPTLAVCRGIQVLNVALGGTLDQHVDEHMQLDRYNVDAHLVTIEPGSRLAAVVGTTTLGVNTLHHQVLATLGDGVRVVARNEDGHVEGVEVDGAPNVLAVQWHPELLRHRPEHLALFAQLVGAGTA